MKSEITPNMRLQKLSQYDKLNNKAVDIARKMRNGEQVNANFVNADGEHVGFDVTPRFLFGMYRIKERAFKDYLIKK